MSEGNVCFYCLYKAAGGVCVCLDCRTKLEQAKRDLERQNRAVARERALFFRLSKENQKLREAVAKAERRKR